MRKLKEKAMARMTDEERVKFIKKKQLQEAIMKKRREE